MLARIADALERSAERGQKDAPATDAGARQAVVTLVERVKALEARSAGQDPARVLMLEARVDALEGSLRKLRGKVYRDPEFHEPRAREHAEQQEAYPGGLLGGPMLGAGAEP